MLLLVAHQEVYVDVILVRRRVGLAPVDDLTRSGPATWVSFCSIRRGAALTVLDFGHVASTVKLSWGTLFGDV